MGGKKKKAAPKIVNPNSLRNRVPNSWDCPLCRAPGAFHVKLNKKDGVGEAQCRACKQPSPHFVMKLTPLSAKVDVFLKFYDELVQRDRAALQEMNVPMDGALLRQKKHVAAATDSDNDDQEDGGFPMEVDNNEDE